MNEPSRPVFIRIGSNETILFGFDADERARRLAASIGLCCADGVEGERGAVLANMAYAWDLAWLKLIAVRRGSVLMAGGDPVLANVRGHSSVDPVEQAMIGNGGSLEHLEVIDCENAEVANEEWRSKGRPFALRLTPATAEQVEQAAYVASCPSVTDALTLYLWRKPSFHLTRWAAEAAISPNTVTAVGAVLCLMAFFYFWFGNYWLGAVAGFIFMGLDTIDGRLARCTVTESKPGKLVARAIDLVHPPFWWWAWAHGLSAYTRPLEPVYEVMLLAAIVGGYLAQRIIEGVFIARFKIPIHVWRPIDSRFRLITAGRNSNLAILVGALVFGRPDLGLGLVGLWTIISLLFHLVRLSQAETRAYRGAPVVSWLA